MIGDRNLCRPFQSVIIILMTKQIRVPIHGRPILLVTRMIYRPSWTQLSPITITGIYHF